MPTKPATLPDTNQLPLVQQFVSILWPSFITAAVATIVFFTLFDPKGLSLIAGLPDVTRLAGYTIGFFAFWIVTSLSSGLTCYFRRPCPPRASQSSTAGNEQQT